MVLVTPAPLSEEQIGPDGKITKITSIESTTAKKAGNGAERRLVEYFVVVSSLPKRLDKLQIEASSIPAEEKINATEPMDWKVNIAFEKGDEEYVGSYDIKPEITARYPVQDHRDNPLHENVTFFCHPSGGIRLCMEPNMPKVRFLLLLLLLLLFTT